MWTLVLTLAQAQDFVDAELPPINAQRFRPTIDGRRTLWTDDATRGEHKQFTLRPLIHYTHQPLVYEFANGEQTGLVNNVFQMDLMGGFSFDRLRIGVDLPVYFYSDSDITGGQTGLGDIAVDGKVTVIGREKPVGLALNGRLNLPTASVENPLGVGNLGWEVAGIVDTEFDAILLAANLGIRGAPKADLENVFLNDFFVFRTAAGVKFSERSGTALEVTGDIPLSPDGTNGTPIEWLGSGYGGITKNIAIRGGFGTSFTNAVAAPDWRAILGVTWQPAANEDRDGDGISDSEDSCPDVAEDFDNESDSDGCPEDIGSVVVRVVDAAGAVISSATVAVPGTSHNGKSGLKATMDSGAYTAQATAEGYESSEVQFTVADADVDTVVDVVLQKVSVPMGTLKVVVRDVAGQPINGAIVSVGDSTVENLEMQHPVGKVGVEARADGYKRGTPKIANVVDGRVTEVVIVLEEAKAQLSGERIDLRDSVYFDTNKAVIQQRSFSLLEDVVEILNDHPELTKIRIEGHTDSRGSASYNKDLSQRRAASVREFLISKGIPATRLESAGFGEEKPIDPANNAAAWEKNRRVDFFVAERSD